MNIGPQARIQNGNTMFDLTIDQDTFWKALQEPTDRNCGNCYNGKFCAFLCKSCSAYNYSSWEPRSKYVEPKDQNCDTCKFGGGNYSEDCYRCSLVLEHNWKWDEYTKD